MVRAVGLKVLKNKLSEYVRLAAGGDTILVTDREQVVAELGPPRSTRGETVSDSMLAQLVREGVLTPALDRHAQIPEPSGLATLDEILAELDQTRADR